MGISSHNPLRSDTTGRRGGRQDAFTLRRFVFAESQRTKMLRGRIRQQMVWGSFAVSKYLSFSEEQARRITTPHPTLGSENAEKSIPCLTPRPQPQPNTFLRDEFRLLPSHFPSQSLPALTSNRKDIPQHVQRVMTPSIQ